MQSLVIANTGSQGEKSCFTNNFPLWQGHQVDQRKTADVNFLDFSKAFNTLTASFWTKCAAYSYTNTVVEQLADNVGLKELG